MLQALAKNIQSSLMQFGLIVARPMEIMHDIKELAISKCQDRKMAESKLCQFAVTWLQNSSACSFCTKASVEIVFTDIGTILCLLEAQSKMCEFS